MVGNWDFEIWDFSIVFFDESTLRKLDQLALVASRIRAGAMKGERRSTKRGTSIEFADYRDYARGDDLRRVDWNVYARLERPFVKLFEEEEDLAVHVVVDASKSMNWPDGSMGAEADSLKDRNKFQYAVRLAAALGHIALAAGDRLTVSVVRGGGLPAERFGPKRGRGSTGRLLKFLGGLSAEGATDLDGALRNYALATDRAGLAFVISDLFSPGYQTGLNAMQSKGHEVGLVHILAPEEVEPPLAGDLQLIDIETGDPQDVSVDGPLRELYKRRVGAWRDEIEAHCLKRGVHYVPVTTDVKWDQIVLYQMRKMGLVK
ncbi:MAG TPA: DUF58 domain-containing protein [Anaerolineales bacterium]|nr:DUF58 domain-containing protein [Anaerolineales bacterium]